ncbi:hypothetical protein BD769DRAFT_1450661 [Suillus cothurnatus]|nr:hypothetical protein BD769DRAFT_1450661 [Suillus cothurnatus]
MTLYRNICSPHPTVAEAGSATSLKISDLCKGSRTQKSHFSTNIMHSINDNLDSLGAEDQLISLRGQINEIKEYIDLLMRQSAIIRERRCLLEDQQDVKPPAIMEQLDFTPPETSSVNLPDIKSTQDSAVSGPSLALDGAADCHSVCDNLCVAASSHTRWVPHGRPSFLIIPLSFNHLHNLKAARPSRWPYLAGIIQDVVNSRESLHGMNLMNLLLCIRGGQTPLAGYFECYDCFDLNNL